MVQGGGKLTQIVKVIPTEDYKLEVFLDNGSSITLNLENRLQTVRFSILSDRDFFKKVITDGARLLWEDKLEISLSEVFQLAQK
jgi:hypothetical protein